jgi:hypothetical protein
MIAYKVVKKLLVHRDLSKGIFVSAFASGQARIIYRIGELVEVPPWLQSLNMYPLLFSEDRFARTWMESLITNELYLLACEVDKEVVLHPKALLERLKRGEIIPDFDKYDDSPSYPIGTVSYKKIIPTSVIYEKTKTKFFNIL